MPKDNIKNLSEKIDEMLIQVRTIVCNECGHYDESTSNESSFLNDIDKKGWVVLRDKVYCPSCYKKTKHK